LVLSVLYAQFNNLPKFTSLFNGLQVIVIAIIFNATYLFGKDITNNYKKILTALLAAISFWFGVSPFVVIIVAGILGITLLKVSASSNIVNSETKETPWNAKQIIGLLVTFLICFMGLYLLSVECHDIVDGKMCHHIVDKVL
jgi:chromate transporter